MAKRQKKQEAPAQPQQAAPVAQAPRLPGLTIDELKALLGDKEVLIMQLQKQLGVYQEQIAYMAQELQARQEEIDKLRGKKKGKKAKAEDEAEGDSEDETSA